MTNMHECSQQLHDRAAVIPGRSLTRSKAPGRFYDVGLGPLYAQSGDGCIIIDVDQNRYIDMLCALGAVSLGYGVARFGQPSGAVCAMQDGWVLSLPHSLEVKAAEIVLEHVAPWATHVRFMKTGSEATQAAFQVARRATGRKHVLVGDWAYHGWHSWVEDALKYPHGMNFDLDFYKLDVGVCDIHREDVAAVFIEPHRWEQVSVQWLQDVRDWCTRVGALFVFDEMIYGGRWHLGGATSHYGITPDLACFGKAIGNGAPIACVVGRDVLARYGELASGTYSGDTAALASLVDTLRVYTREPVVDTLWKRGYQLRRGLKEIAESWNAAHAVKLHNEGAVVHQRLRFMAEDGHDVTLGKSFAAAMAKRGVLWHPDCVNVCFSHTEAHIERVIEAGLLAIREVEHASETRD